MTINQGLFTSADEDWETPDYVFDFFNNRYNFTLDAAASNTNFKVLNHFTKKENGLSQSWEEHRVWLNPPYGRDIKRWFRKCSIEQSKARLICVLAPARTDTQWFHVYVLPFATKVFFIEGRIAFKGSFQAAPFPSMVVLYYPFISSRSNLIVQGLRIPKS